MLEYITPQLSPEQTQKKDEAIYLLKKRYKDYFDPWGFDLEVIEKTIHTLLPIYHKYFKVRVFGKENVENIPYMLISNHTGQLPIDAMLITMAFATEVHPPRVLHGMIERFMSSFPFLGPWSQATGSILGDRDNCLYLMEKGESILVFPEGVRGVSKNTPDYYKLQNFSNGFLRMALTKNIPILPIAVIGAEEMYPFVVHAKGMAKTLGLPALPLSPNFFPLPSPIDIYIGKPYYLPQNLSSDATDKEIRVHVEAIENQIKEMIETGLQERRPFIDPIRKPITKLIKKIFNHEQK